MTTESKQLLDELTSMCHDHEEQLRALSALSDEELATRPAPGSWNVLECIEHLNRYGRFYLPEIRKRINESSHKPSPRFRSGMLGNYFAESMLPRPGFKTMNTFKEMNPLGSDLNRSVMEEFADQLNEMKAILDEVRTKNLNKVRTSISISKWIKLKLGDTLRVVIYHNERHLLQAARCIRIKSDQEEYALP